MTDFVAGDLQKIAVFEVIKHATSLKKQANTAAAYNLSTNNKQSDEIY